MGRIEYRQDGSRVGHRGKLEDWEVRMLREYRIGGWSHKELAFLFGISEHRSSEICRGRAYKNSPGPIDNLRVYHGHRGRPEKQVLRVQFMAVYRGKCLIYFSQEYTQQQLVAGVFLRSLIRLVLGSPRDHEQVTPDRALLSPEVVA